MASKTYDLIVTTSVLKAVAEGVFPDKNFAKSAERSHIDDMKILRNLNKAAWGEMCAKSTKRVR